MAVQNFEPCLYAVHAPPTNMPATRNIKITTRYTAESTELPWWMESLFDVGHFPPLGATHALQPYIPLR